MEIGISTGISKLADKAHSVPPRGGAWAAIWELEDRTVTLGGFTSERATGQYVLRWWRVVPGGYDDRRGKGVQRTWYHVLTHLGLKYPPG